MEGRELKLNIAYTPDIAKGEFANLVMLSTHSDECRLDFVYVDRMTEDSDGLNEGYLVSRVSLPPSQLVALRNMIDAHLDERAAR